MTETTALQEFFDRTLESREMRERAGLPVPKMKDKHALWRALAEIAFGTFDEGRPVPDYVREHAKTALKESDPDV